MKTRKVNICGKTIPGNEVLIVAEIGSCHDGNLRQAKEMVRRSAAAGADVAKLQFFRAEHLYFQSDSRFEAAKGSETPLDWLPILNEVADQAGVALTASGFHRDTIDTLVKGGAPFLKIASPEIRDPVLIKVAAESSLPVVLSTGVSSTSDVAKAVEWAEACGAEEIVILQCASVYPASIEDMNLRAIETLRTTFGWPVGLSDHTLSIVPPVVAAARGASIIEKHVTPDRSLEGVDHDVALTFSEFEEMAKRVRQVEDALADERKAVLDGESVHNHKISLVARRKIEKGEEMSFEKLSTRRANPKVDPFEINKIIGMEATRRIEKGEKISRNMFKV
jgi:sialic acid synthase SpsE